MKKSIVLIVCLFLVACQNSNDSKLEERAQEIVLLAQADGYKDMSLKSAKDGVVKLSQENMCDITATFKDEKLVSISTEKNGSSNEEYSCVMRTLVRDQDFLGTDEQKNIDFLNKFRDSNNFEFAGLKVEKDDYTMKITKVN